jgi:hypothetical protein
MSEAMGSLVETLSSAVDWTACDYVLPSEHSTLHMSSVTCPEAVLRHSFLLLTEQCGWSETYMLWIKDWCAVELHQICCEAWYA